MKTKEKKLTSIRINKNLYAHLQKKAKEENRSMNNYIETLLFEASEFEVPNEETVAAIQEVKDHIAGKIVLDKMKKGESAREFLTRIMNED
ncbi:MAG: toxin-antitoxin system protein [Flavobacteriia bacterium]|nr:toxin-antitoxin system protein [Flavobacteriia bacterium]